MSKIEIKGKAISYESTPQGHIVTFEGAVEIVEKPEPKPLLADAKVGDWAENRSGKFVKILQTNGISSSYPIICSDMLSTTIDGKHVQKKISDSDIICLIPQGTPEWQDLETADLLAKYPNIERDLTTVRNGDTLLFDNGETRIAISSEGNELFINTDRPVTTYPYSLTFVKSTGKHRTLSVTCLGIIKRAEPNRYTTLEIVKMIESGKCMEATSKSANITLVNSISGHKPMIKIDEATTSTYTMDSIMLTATDWVVVR